MCIQQSKLCPKNSTSATASATLVAMHQGNELYFGGGHSVCPSHSWLYDLSEEKKARRDGWRETVTATLTVQTGKQHRRKGRNASHIDVLVRPLINESNVSCLAATDAQ